MDRHPRWSPSGRRPPWWPPEEPWPPRGPGQPHDEWRSRVARRAGWYSFLPIWMLVWAIVARPPWGSGRETSSGVWLLVVCAAIAGSVALVLRRIAVPVADLIAAANRIARRDFRARVESDGTGPRWVRDVSRAFNAMATELDAQDQARRHLMADIAHELRTPLAIVQGKLEGLIDGVYPRDDERLQGLLEDTRVLARLVDDLRTLSTAESGALGLTKEPTDIVALVHDVVSSLEQPAQAAGVRLEIRNGAGPNDQAISMDPVRIREVLINLLINALASHADEWTCDHRGFRRRRSHRASRGGYGSGHRGGRTASDLRSLPQGCGFARIRPRIDDCEEPGRSPRRHDPGGEHRRRRHDDRVHVAAVSWLAPTRALDPGLALASAPLSTQWHNSRAAGRRQRCGSRWPGRSTPRWRSPTCRTCGCG